MTYRSIPRIETNSRSISFLPTKKNISFIRMRSVSWDI